MQSLYRGYKDWQVSKERYWVGVDESKIGWYPGYFDGCPGGGPITPDMDDASKINGRPTTFYNDDPMELWVGGGGEGAPGADAPSPMELSPTAYGQGGIGGMGGGGGGGSGEINPNLDFSKYTISGRSFGFGGVGGNGSDGAPGCILVYY